MSNLIPAPGGISEYLDRRPGTGMSRRTSRALSLLEQRTVVRLAEVQAEKVREVNHLTREAMSGHALLGRWRDTLAAGDPFIADELKFFTDLARMGKGEIIASTVTGFTRGSR